MIFDLDICVDRASWPTTSGPSFPPAFVPVARGPQATPIALLPMLVLLGKLTTPVSPTGAFLSEYWAWIRYLYAVDHSRSDLVISDGFTELDPHQKTILSDDFGVGLSMYWLTGTLDLFLVADGAYFAKHMAQLLHVRLSPKRHKRGPRKAPDFVALDLNGRWHVVECKGTQTSLGYRNRQLMGPSSSRTLAGGIAQKQTIIFPPSLAGQRLACGTFIAPANKGRRSEMRVIDPPYKPLLDLTETQCDYAVDAMVRANVAQALFLADMKATASRFISPDGFLEFPGYFDSQEQEQFAFKERLSFLSDRRKLSEHEVTRASKNLVMTRNEREAVLNEITFSLPRSLEVGGLSLTRISIRHYCDWEAIERTRSDSDELAPLNDRENFWLKNIGPPKFEFFHSKPGQAPQISCSMETGNLLTTKMTLLP